MPDKPRTFRTRIREITAWKFGHSSDGVCRGDKDDSCYEARSHVHTAHDGQIILVRLGDWIIPEPDGVHYYAVKPHIFAENYEEVR